MSPGANPAEHQTGDRPADPCALEITGRHQGMYQAFHHRAPHVLVAQHICMQITAYQELDR
jgi:hypothetical protein